MANPRKGLNHASHDAPSPGSAPRLREVTASGGQIDRDAERAVFALLGALGADATEASLRKTPRRVVDTYPGLRTPTSLDMTTFANDEGYDESVLARSIPFRSICRHHLLTFHGVAHVAYLPDGPVLSRLARVVGWFARAMQLQERLIKQIADWLETQLRLWGVGVVLEAEHLCRSVRGVERPGTRTVTCAFHGLIRDDPPRRRELLGLTGISS